ncbi:MAG TPA: uracil-DNA glycosylase [Longimicrobiales bacterium]|nr:uracil-DNA glycosylase [Longimicrobiales bacterium]
MMDEARTTFARYLVQRREMGESTLFLETLTRDDVLGLAAGTRSIQRPSAAVADNAPDRLRELNVLRGEAMGCTKCRLHETRSTVVFSRGSETAEVVVVGEAPGQEEDRTGFPFVGPAGRLLDKLLLSAGFPRESVYVCNVLKCRPPSNRNPQRDEIDACSSYLRRQIELVAPRVLLAVGKFAAQTLLATDTSIGKLRGQIHDYGGIPVITTFHPAFLLRSPRYTRAAWQDFQLMRRVLDGGNTAAAH